MKRVTLPCAGLATDPNPYITAAQGALQRADDVIIKHPNVASLRPSFPVALSQETDQRPRAMHVYQGTPVVSSVDGGSHFIETVSDVLDSDANAPDATISPTQFVEARHNLYYTTYKGVRKITAPDAVGVAAGLKEALGAAHPPSTAVSSSAPLPTGFVWAYRTCIVRKDANDVIVRSAPSPWWTYENASGSTVAATWAVAIASDVVEGDVLELYRSLAVATGSTPSDVLFLSHRQTVTSANVLAGWVSMPDLAIEDELGAELYTNSTREGSLKANYPPPSAVALERAGSCVWYGNTSDRHTLGIQIRTPMATSVAASNADGVCAGTRNATGTAPNAFFTMAGGTGGIHIGMYVWDGVTPDVAGTYFDANTVVTNIVGTTVSISKPLLGSPAGATVNISDGVTVDGTLFYAVPAGSWTEGTREFPVYATGDRAFDVGKLARGLAHNITRNTSCYAYATEDPLTAGTIIIRREDIDAAAFSVSWTTDATSSSAAGSIVSLAADLSQTSSALIKPNRIYYSKPDEPEHVPLVNYVSVGAEGAPVYAMARSRDALLVFKSDGVFKVTGSAPDAWRVDEIDSVTRVFRGSCVAEMGGLVYAWTNRGAVAVSELGVQLLSARRISRELDPFAFYMSEEPATAGCYVTTWPDAGLVLFGVPASEGSFSTSHIYVYSETTSGWSRWVMSTLCAARDRDSIALYIANADGWRLAKNSIGVTAEGTIGYDTSHSVLTWVLDDVSVSLLIADAGAWVPEVGDWVSTFIADERQYRQVTDVSDDGTAYTLTISSTFADADSSLTAYEAIKPAIEWQPATAPDAFSTCLWREAQVALEVDSSVDAGDLRWTLGASNEHATDAVTLDVTSERGAVRRTTLRAGIDREVARGVECAPYFAGSNIFAPWHCRGVTVVFSPDGGDAERSVR